MTIHTTHDHLARIAADLNAGRDVDDRDDLALLDTAIDGGAIRFTANGAKVVSAPADVAIGVPNLPTAVAVRNMIADAWMGRRKNLPLANGVDVVVRPDKDDIWIIGYQTGVHGPLMTWVADIAVLPSDNSDADEWVLAADLVDGDVIDLATVPILSAEPSANFEMASVESVDPESSTVIGLYTDGGSAGVAWDLRVRRTRHGHLASHIIGGTDPASAIEKVVERIREAEQDNAEQAVRQGDLPGSALADCQSAAWIMSSVEQMDDGVLEDIVGYGIPGGVVREILLTYFDNEDADGQDTSGRIVESWSEAGVAKIAAAMGVSVEDVKATLAGDLAEPAMVTVVPGRSWLVYREQEAADGTRPREWAGVVEAADGLFDANCTACRFESAGHKTRQEAANLLVRRHGPDGRRHGFAAEEGIEFAGMSRVEYIEDGRVRVLLAATGETVAILPVGASLNDADAAVGRWLTAGRPSPLHTGSDPERGSVGLPGHCDDCAAIGHVQAHPDLGCGDVGCTHAHDEDPAPHRSPAAGLAPAARKAAVAATAAILGVSGADAGNLLDGIGDQTADSAVLVGRIVEAYATRRPDAIVVARLLDTVHGIEAAWDADDGDQVLVIFHDRAKAAWWGPDGLVVEFADGTRHEGKSSPDPAKVADRIAVLVGGS